MRQGFIGSCTSGTPHTRVHGGPERLVVTAVCRLADDSRVTPRDSCVEKKAETTFPWN